MVSKNLILWKLFTNLKLFIYNLFCDVCCSREIKWLKITLNCAVSFLKPQDSFMWGTDCRYLLKIAWQSWSPLTFNMWYKTAYKFLLLCSMEERYIGFWVTISLRILNKPVKINGSKYIWGRSRADFFVWKPWINGQTVQNIGYFKLGFTQR